MNIPEKLSLGNLPTKIEPLEKLSKVIGGPNIYIKRDDQTGLEVSGNKVRKLEFAVKEAIDRGCDTLITCGGVQSNHCRATAAVAAKLGLKCYLVLRGNEEEDLDGNYFLDRLLGAKIKFISKEEYQYDREEIIDNLKKKLENNGYKPYIIPMGASNGIGNFGYFNCMKEIEQQEKELGIEFDAVVATVGSGSTYGGLLLYNKYKNRDSKVYGINICDNAYHFKKVIKEIIDESLEYVEEQIDISEEDINIIDGYAGLGYAISQDEELEFIKYLARLEGVILDPVYTGKAMYGLAKEIKDGNLGEHKNILFIHTGGLFGLFPKRNMMKL
ncbi:D-cysteine desulfhydrase family protein [Anaeromicrobium sediminis]|uniref:D-cysteine desulfhydrase n=1 Tax=Anaeromicrobium sediminis TaxID=1478221 RepID=A0A267MLW2_9FIRM|nr:D-cysteine desulfhydrase family protein [Anaeromicrobium sediminis]PAB60579.1 D-cysteine desulfhydrase [Anaeromicrobium sediminis]